MSSPRLLLKPMIKIFRPFLGWKSWPAAATGSVQSTALHTRLFPVGQIHFTTDEFCTKFKLFLLTRCLWYSGKYAVIVELAYSHMLVTLDHEIRAKRQFQLSPMMLSYLFCLAWSNSLELHLPECLYIYRFWASELLLFELWQQLISFSELSNYATEKV